MKIDYGWIVVAAGMVASCVGFGAMPYFWLFVGSAGIGLGAMAIAFTFHRPRPLRVAVAT
ncbi:MAG: hypothetical protein HYR51_04905 [Candidatus Rokubacteria bacterium]|nr:hypothetical protein [Candidatus Rokubacteria bacterium]